MTALPEADIRAAIDEHSRLYGWDMASTDDFHRPFDAVGHTERMLWRPLDGLQASRLALLIEEAERRALERCTALMIEEAVVAARTFASEYPDAVAELPDTRPIPRSRDERVALDTLRRLVARGVIGPEA